MAKLDVVKVSWSGGKDSSAALKMHLDLGHIVKAVCYIPMFTKEIPLITKEHYEFILKTAKRFRSEGAKVYIVSGITYYDFVHTRSSRGEFKGRAFGFPPFKRGWCGFKRDSKVKAIRACDVGGYDYEDIGIAFDEVERHKILSDTKRSILCEKKMTEADALLFDIHNGILSPHYNYTKRDGCALCPNARREERMRWFKDFPEAIPLVAELQEFVKRERPDQTPLWNHKWFIDGDGRIN